MREALLPACPPKPERRTRCLELTLQTYQLIKAQLPLLSGDGRRASNGIMLRTAQQRKTLCHSCPVARVADLLGDSCSLLILRDLLEKPRRFRDLQDSLSGISTRTLSNKLRLLESKKLIQKKEFFVQSPRVEYTLTKKGAALRGVLDAMRKYGKKYL